MKTRKASLEGLARIKQAREERGWAIEDPIWRKEASQILDPNRDWENVEERYLAVSIGTWKRFLQGKPPIKNNTFKAFCQVLGLNWEEVVDNSQSQPTTQPVFLGQDWGAAEPVSDCYGRTQKLNTLKEWILQDKCNLILLLGQGGIGKTTLSIKLAREIQNHFDYIIWRSLEASPSV